LTDKDPLSANEACQENETLERLLRQAGSRLRVDEVRALAHGAAAAAAFDPDSWLTLVDAGGDVRLETRLKALYAEMAASLDGGKGDSAIRLAALRKELNRRGVQGFIVPHSDECQGEYVPRCAERLSWLTGFTGSAGAAVILEDKAAIFVDGRYTLQVREEADGALFEFVSQGDGRPGEWISRNLASDARLGYDPRLHTQNQIMRLETACKKAGGTLEALDDNPLDAVWFDRPPPPISPTVPHEIVFAGESSDRKRQRIAEDIKQDGLGAAVLTASDSIAWLLNIRGGDVPFAPLTLAFAVIHADAAVELFIDRRKLTSKTVRHLGDGVNVEDIEAFGAALDRLGAKKTRTRLNLDGASAWVFARLKKAGADIVPGVDPCALAKACKNTMELDGIRNAHKRDGVALCRFLAWLSGQAPGSGLTEMAAAERLDALRREGEHFRGPSFATISGAGANGAVVHYRVSEKSNRRIENGTLYLVDSGGQYLDGTTDVTRTIAIGNPSVEMRLNFTRVLKCHIALASARFPEGATGSQLDVLARKALWDVGLDYDHGAGHGVGAYLNVHEGPHRISKHPNRVALKPGMVTSIEPGYYKTGAYGIRIENLAAVASLPSPRSREKEMLGFETLTMAPIDLSLVETALLDVGEAVWLDAYHGRIRMELKPLVDAETARWLEQATRPVGWL